MFETEPQAVPTDASGAMVDRLLNIIGEKDAIIREQAEQIGQLRERIARLSSSAPAASCDASALVG